MRVHCVSAVDAATDSCSTPMACSSPMGLVFPMESDETAAKTPLPFEMSAAAAADTLHQLDRLLEPTSDPEHMLARHVELAAGGAHRVDPEHLCHVLQRLGYSAKLHESTAPLYRFKHGVRHQYLTVCLPTTSATGLATYIVEPNFRDCFCVAHPTPRYQALLDGVPTAVVADKACFLRAVTMLCRELALSFAQQAEDLPPWRTQQAILSRWHMANSMPSGPGGCSAWAQQAQQGWPAGDLFAAKQMAALGAD